MDDFDADLADVTEEGYDYAPDPSSVGMDRSNISNSDSYDPTFAAQSKLSQGLDPRGLQGFNTTAFNNPDFLSQYGSNYNPLEQLDELQQANVLNAMTAANSYEKNPGLRNAFIDTYKSDPMSFIENVKSGNISSDEAGQVFGSLGVNLDRPYGDGTFSLFGKEANYSMSPKDKAELGVTALNYNLSGKDPTRFSENPYTTVTSGLQDAGITALKGATDFIMDSVGGTKVSDYLGNLFSSTDRAKENILPQNVQDAIKNNKSIDASTGLPAGQKSYFDQLKDSGLVENASFLQDISRVNDAIPGGIFSGLEKPQINTDILPFNMSGNLQADLPGKNVLSTRGGGQITNKFRSDEGRNLNTTLGNLTGSDKSLSFNFNEPGGSYLNTGNLLDKGVPNINTGYAGENFTGDINLSRGRDPYFSGSYTVPTEEYGDFKINSRGTLGRPDNIGVEYNKDLGIGNLMLRANQNLYNNNPMGKPDIGAFYGFNKRF